MKRFSSQVFPKVQPEGWINCRAEAPFISACAREVFKITVKRKGVVEATCSSSNRAGESNLAASRCRAVSLFRTDNCCSDRRRFQLSPYDCCWILKAKLLCLSPPQFLPVFTITCAFAVIRDHSRLFHWRKIPLAPTSMFQQARLTDSTLKCLCDGQSDRSHR